MIAVKQMDHLNMGVRNIEETKKFYHDLFGFEEKERGIGMDGDTFAIIGAADRVYLCIYEYGDLPLNEENLYIHHFGLHVADFDGALEELREKGIELHYGGGVVQQGKSRSMYVRDPNGYEIELVEKLGGDLH
jgi:catechol 2,3-dioxygenase-like lactoylglutathione lyase family enzyme